LLEPLVTVVIPTLSAGARLQECLASLDAQTCRDFEVTVVDNSGRGLARTTGVRGAAVIEEPGNVGFGAAVNHALQQSRAPMLATLNDDAVPHPEWLAALIQAMQSDDRVGMCASQVRLFGEYHLDSAGMLVAGDGSSKQRGHLHPPDQFAAPEEVLLPSASAALYRRRMLDEIGPFDEEFFLYCEDTDLGLRARWAGWKCLYVPGAVVEHHYSHSAGRASPLKAYYVERNRLFVLAKNFPAGMLLRSPFVTIARYWWHLCSLVRGRGAAAQFRREGNAGWRLALYAVRAQIDFFSRIRSLWKKRKAIAASARLSPAGFEQLLRSHSISARQVAEL
jgi:GT2 family glycosyltransferase